MLTEEQSLAINKQNSNILVSASAGSGKTKVLVERVINHVVKHKVDINKILIVTFTNAAAVELKERLLLAIYEELNKNPKDEFLKRQLKYINIANIDTIHSFCLDIIRSNFHVLNINPNFSICDETDTQILKIKAINRVLEKRYTESIDNKEEQIKLYNLLELFSAKEELLVEYILKIYNYIMSFPYPFDYLKSSIEKYNLSLDTDLYNVDFGKEIFISVVDDMRIISKKLEMILKEIEGSDDFLKYYELLDNESKMLNICINSKSWDILYDNLLNFKFERLPNYKGGNLELKEKVVSFRNKILKGAIQDFKEIIYAKSKDIVEDNKIAYDYLKYIYDLILEFNDEYLTEKQKNNLIDFNDIEHFALELLVNKSKNELNGEIILEKTDIAKNLTEKFDEVYTDEYQDTSTIQEEILNSVSNGNNRFMVGDIKQSIYRFRQAMPDIFVSKYDEYKKISSLDDAEKNSKIILAKNFRSRKEVLDSINYIFEKIMSKEVGSIDYEKEERLEFGASKYLEANENDYRTEINIIDLKKDEVSEEESNKTDEVSSYIEELKSFEIESINIAKRIKELVGKFDVFDIKTGEKHKAKYKDIVILIRNLKDKGTILENTLRDMSIPAFCDKSSSVFESDEVKLLLSLLRVLDNPYQDVYMVSIMYSIIGGFSLDDIVYIRSNNRNLNLYDNLNLVKVALENKKNDDNDRLTEYEETIYNKIDIFLSLIQTLRDYSKIYDIPMLISKIYNITNIYTQYNLDDNSKLKKQNLLILIDIANVLKSKNIFTISEYIKYIDNIKEKFDSSNSAAKIIGENENVVRIMTIHKSKGLEFPIVILCDMMRKYNMMDLSSNIILHNKLGIGINIVNKKFNVTYPSIIKQAIKSVSEKEIKSEELRMLYVALTRAKEKLIIFASLKDYNKLKDNQFIMYDDKKIDSAIVLQNSTYFENICMCLKNSTDVSDFFDIRVTSVNDMINDEILNSSKSTFNVEDSISKVRDELAKIKEEYDKEDAYKVESDILNIISKNLNYSYKNIDLVNTLSRVSVSKLKHESDEYVNKSLESEKKYDENMDLVKLDDKYMLKKYPVPNILNEEVRYSPLRKGTLIHFILEHLDLKKDFTLESLKEYIASLYEKGVLADLDVKTIDVKKIYNFITSNLGKDIKNSNSIFKEEEFILKNSSFSKSVIQGVIDLYYINKNGNIVLVDFKTDRLKDETGYLLRYKKQLDIYKEALEKLTKKKVEHSYIYSFELNKEIEVF